MLERVVQLLADEGFIAASADVTILAERPLLAPHLVEMSRRLGEVVGCVVSVKATTTDGLGALGQGDGIAASAVALVTERP
jgi:2-C-methyl-D-erythritol 2,4-cyclodiphosphate synthase